MDDVEEDAMDLVVDERETDFGGLDASPAPRPVRSPTGRIDPLDALDAAFDSMQSAAASLPGSSAPAQVLPTTAPGPPAALGPRTIPPRASAATPSR